MCNNDNDCENNALGFQCLTIGDSKVCGCGSDQECREGLICGEQNQCRERIGIIEKYQKCNEIPTDADCTSSYNCRWSVAESECQLNVAGINNCNLLKNDCANINGQDCFWDETSCKYR